MLSEHLDQNSLKIVDKLFPNKSSQLALDVSQILEDIAYESQMSSAIAEGGE